MSDRPRIFCSGKINNDGEMAQWRVDLGFKELFPKSLDRLKTIEALSKGFPPNLDPNYWVAPLGSEVDYCGPYPLIEGAPKGELRRSIYLLCRTLVRHATHLFCWVDHPDCHGAITEIAWARDDQHVFIAYPETMKDLSKEMWFVNQRAFNRDEGLLFDRVEDAWLYFLTRIEVD